MEFIAWPKTPRFNSESIVVTEKIDGTNAQICITPEGELFVGSRNRWIIPEDDNYGFATWVQQNKDEVLKLGHGRHYGEWWGSGIQRGYNQTEKRLSLFNTARPRESMPEGIDRVPVLYQGEFSTTAIGDCIERLKQEGSIAAPGFMNIEGVCIYFCRSKQVYKIPFGK